MHLPAIRLPGLAAVTAAALVVAAAALLSPAGAASTVTVKLPQAVCHAPKPHHRGCDAIRLVTRQVSPTTAAGLKAAGVARPTALGFGPAGGYTPTQLATAYGINPNAATSQTVAIVDAYDDPSVLSDLNTFDANYGFPAETSTSFRVVNQDGNASPLPTADTGWAPEITLDVQAVRAVCRSCKILLVEADSNQNGDLGTAVDRAVSMGATIVSNSYGSAENDPGNTQAVVADYNHPGVAILASSGDEGWYGWDLFNILSTGDGMPSTPASFPSVVGVGGTSLYLNADGTRAGEQVWNDNGGLDVAGSAIGDSYLVTAGAAGSGCSSIYNAPRWQQKVAGYSTLGCGSTARNGVDIAADADYLTGFDIYETFDWCTSNCPTDGWATFGGTSLASPLVAGMWGLAGGPKGVKSPALTLYGHYQSTPGKTYDVTIGGNGACDTGSPSACATFFGVDNPNTFGFGPLDCAWGGSGSVVLADRAQCYAQPGYDGVSGVGTPVGLGGFAPMSPTARITQAANVTHGTAHTFSGATSTDPFPGGSLTTYRWTWGDGTSFTTQTPTADHTYAKAGTVTVTLKVTDNYGRSNTVTKQVTVQ
jgi:hypothetical protein